MGIGEVQAFGNLILLLSADADIQSAFNKYEEYQEGRVGVFRRQLELALTVVRRHPHIGAPCNANYRRMLVRDFPVGIFYLVTPARIVVVAVLDLRQDPRSIEKRLSSRP